MPKQHFMVDLETLDTISCGVILSIGCKHFGSIELGLTPGFYIVLDIDEQKRMCRTASAATEEWWSRQSPEARKVLTEPKTSIDVALIQFSKFLEKYCPNIHERYVWGNAASFDLKMLESLYRDAGLPVPWSYRNELCYRTLQQLSGHRANMPKGMVAHNALVDAEWQAEQAEIMWDILGIGYRMRGE